MKTVVLHIGRQKTGTTSIQSTLAENRAALSSHGIYYPDAGRSKDSGHHQLAAYLNQTQTDNNRIKTFRKSFFSEIDARPEPVIVVSSEGLQNIRDLSRVREFFADLNVIVVCYLREVLVWKQSSWAQRVHAQYNYIDPFVLSAVQNRANYDEFYQRWSVAFKDTRFALFERERLLDGDVVADFLSKIGLNLPSTELNGLARSQENPSLGGNLLYFKMMMNLAHQGQEKLQSKYNVLTDLAAAEPRWRQKWFVSAEDASRIRNHDKNSNDFLRQKFEGLSETETWLYPPMPDSVNLREDFVRILKNPALENVFQPLGLVPALCNSNSSMGVDRVA